MKYSSILVLGLLFLCSGCVVPSKTLESHDARAAASTSYIQRDYVKAEPAYKELTQKEPNNPDNWFRLGNIYANTQRYDLAIGAYKQATNIQPSLSQAWHNLGVVYMRQAGNAFLQLRMYTQPNDPLHKTARDMTNAVAELLGDTSSE